MKEYFAMIMLVELDKLDVPFREFTEEMKQSGKEFGVDISVMHEDIFNTMHRI
jgi:ACT domain-containing protein